MAIEMKEVNVNQVVPEKGTRKDGSWWYSLRIVFAALGGRSYEKRVFLDDKEMLLLDLNPEDFLTYVNKRK